MRISTLASVSSYHRFFLFKSVGCDLVLGSGEKFDGCGVCKGDGSSCKAKLDTANSKSIIVSNATDNTTQPLKVGLSSSNFTNIVNDTTSVAVTNGSLNANSTEKTKTVNATSQENATGKIWF